MFLKFICVLFCIAFAAVAGNEVQQESTTDNSSDEDLASIMFGRLHGTILTVGESTFDLLDSNMSQIVPNVTFLVVTKQGPRLQIDTFECVKTLQVLSLDGNDLTAVPKEALSRLSSLKVLSIMNNRLEALRDGDEFSTLGNLRVLYLTRNFISVVHPHTFASLRTLQSLDLSENLLTSLDGLILPPENQLTMLKLSNNYLKSFNESIFIPMHALKELSLDGNHLEMLRENTFAELHALQRLDLGGNFFKTLPSKLFTSNKQLAELLLTKNLIEQLPGDVFRGLKNLDHLDLQENRLSELPEEIFLDKVQFTYLGLEMNRIANIKPSLLKSADVHMQNNRLQVLSKSSFATNATLVERLFLYGNEIATIEPSVFEGLPKLEFIYLDHNQIAELSPMLFHTNHQLEQVSLSHNRLTVLRTNTFSGLAKLHQVDLSYNLLSAIEPAVFHHSPIEYLTLNGNQLTTLNDWTFSGTNLRYLHLDSNALVSVSSAGTALDGLAELSAANNRIASWQEFCSVNFTRLGELNLANNSLPSMDSDCLEHLLTRGNISPDTDPLTVNVAYNTLTVVPALAGRIQSLDLSGNDVSDLGDGNAFLRYEETQRLVLQNTSLRMLRSVSFTFLQNLTQLEIGSSVLEQIEEDAFHALKLLQLVISNSSLVSLPPLLLQEQTSLSDLSLAYNELSYLPSAFFNDCIKLVDIDLSHNRIKTVDELWFQHLLELRIINLDNNYIAQLPPNMLSTQHSLRTLALAGNALESIADAVFLANVSIIELNLAKNNLTNIDILERNDFITELDVSQNRLDRLLVRPNYQFLQANSNKITSLRLEADSRYELERLNLADNQLCQLNPQIFDARMITDLNVSENRLDKFPFELVYRLKHLNNLIVSRNNIRTLPPTVERFKLQTLDLSENPLEQQPNTFLDACVINNLIVTVAK